MDIRPTAVVRWLGVATGLLSQPLDPDTQRGRESEEFWRRFDAAERARKVAAYDAAEREFRSGSGKAKQRVQRLPRILGFDTKKSDARRLMLLYRYAHLAPRVGRLEAIQRLARELGDHRTTDDSVIATLGRALEWARERDYHELLEDVPPLPPRPTPGRHRFGTGMICERCGSSLEEQQRAPSRCPGREPPTSRPPAKPLQVPAAAGRPGAPRAATKAASRRRNGRSRDPSC